MPRKLQQTLEIIPAPPFPVIVKIYYWAWEYLKSKRVGEGFNLRGEGTNHESKEGSGLRALSSGIT